MTKNKSKLFWVMTLSLALIGCSLQEPAVETSAPQESQTAIPALTAALPDGGQTTGSQDGEPLSAVAILLNDRLPLAYLTQAAGADDYSFTETYYVSSSTGDDSNDGKTPETAFKTLSTLSRIRFAPGTGIFLKCGDTFEESATFRGSGTADQPIVLTHYGEGTLPLITYATQVLSFDNVSGWTIDGIAVCISSQEPLTASYQGSQTQGAIHFNYTGDAAAAYSDMRVVNCEISGDGCNKNTRGIILAAVYDEDFAVIKNITLAGNNIHDLGWLGAAAIAWNTDTSAQYAVPGVFQNVVIEGNYFHNIGHIACYTHAVQGGSFSRNYGHDIGVYDDPEPIDWGLCGFMTIGCDDFDIAFNELHSILDANVGYDGVALDIDWSSSNVRVTNNYTYDCYGAGISTMASRDCAIENNRVRGNKVKTYLPGGQITLTDFTGDVSDDRITGIRGYSVAGNLIRIDVEDTCAMGTMKVTGGDAWADNQFTGNHVILASTDSTRMLNLLSPSLFDLIDGNLYFTDGPYKAVLEAQHLRADSFADWQAGGQDTGSQVLAPDNTAPTDVSGLTAQVADGRVTVRWDASKDDESGLWHYNIHLGSDAAPIPVYPNMLGETDQTEYTFDAPALPGRYYVLVTAENNMGVLSRNAAVAIITVE